MEINELTLPTGPGATGWDDLTGYVAMLADRYVETVGGDDLAPRVEAIFAYQRSQTYAHKVIWLARSGAELVGYADYERAVDHSDPAAEINVYVRPEHRRQGLGRRLLDTVLAQARAQDATAVHTGTEHLDLTTPPRLPAPTGFGDVPADDPATRFLLDAGFRLAQVEITSALELPVSTDRLTELASGLRPAPGYELIGWVGDTPEDEVEEFARLRTVMSTAAPVGELTEVEQVWDAARVRDRDTRNRAMGLVTVMTAAREVSSGDLVAFTLMNVDADNPRAAVGQGYTLVLDAHRGHNLGLRIKLANLQRLAEVPTSARRVITGNAGENDAMLSINRAIGYRPAWVTGWWELNLTDDRAGRFDS